MTVQTVVTGLAWMGIGVRSVKSALKDMLRNAEHEVLLCAYSVTDGADTILDELEDCLKRGITFKAIINRFEQQSPEIQSYFLKLIRIYPYCEVYNFNSLVEELHSKLIVVDRSTALIGSANLSRRGMQHNYELGVILRDREVDTLSKCFDSLITLPIVFPITTQIS